MSDLIFNPVFQDVSKMFRNQMFSAMYFGQHCGKNLLILKHDLTVMIAFGDVNQWSTPELIKAVSFRGDRKKGTQIVGNENIILLLDECGSLWRLVNAFEASTGETESFHSLGEECFYEWIPFKKFSFMKVLAISTFEEGFACLGVSRNFERKLIVLPCVDSPLEEYTFNELNTQETNFFSYYLTNLKIENSVNAYTSCTTEKLLVTDRISGETYLCAKNERHSLINLSDNFLISAVHLEEKKCVLLCFKNGKLISCFYNNSQKEGVVYLSKKLVFVEKCYCLDTCLLWSDGISLNHTKLTFLIGDDLIKVIDLKLSCCVQNPLSVVKMKEHALIVTMNNFYYTVRPGLRSAKESQKHPNELLTEICSGANFTAELEKKIDLLSHYLHSKDIIQKGNIKEKTQIKWEGNSLVIKSNLGVSLREQLWKVRLMSSGKHKRSVCVTDLEADLNKEVLLIIENPFEEKCRIKASLIGDFEKKDLFLDLGEVSVLEPKTEKDSMSKQVEKILMKRRSKLNIQR